MFRYTLESDIGRKREVNEDQAAVLRRPDGLFLGIVADGMGGHNAGDLASRMAAEELGRLFMEEEETAFLSAEAKKDWLLQSVKQINRQVYNHALLNPACSGMGTTLLAAIVSRDDCVLCHIGDSRAYVFDGTARQITRDHTYVNLLVDTGELSQAEAEDHPKKHLIIRALGTEPDIEGDLLEVELTASLCLLLCSDGLSNKLSEAEIAAVLHGELPLAEKGNELIRRANELGGEDNISFVLFCADEEVKR
ncbi:Stp1/IreP family PP2C-type Ser/Thr phosphatase [Planococcus lenghuensis]|uniref:Protein phosphatase n=1 Tax=Planococcus lenghuensis TaxID=2213202 RepID=A0A1Q2KZY9_9BACL|nr:Stp1/IreP family PP2C-type Ser/Thr phosphatase [Planococcus lenghuensis]AQQ53765.1 protein phosphatase [Planococcus lenghuensis]